MPKLSAKGRPNQTIIAKAMPKNVPQSVNAKPRCVSVAIWAIKVGAATTSARCDAPSIKRRRNMTGSGGKSASTSETAAPSHNAQSSERR